MALSDDDKQIFSPLKSEMYEALLSCWAYHTKMGHLGERLQTSTRSFLLEETTALRALANDIILKLCNLDDDKSSFSLHALRKHAFRSERDQKTIKEINREITRFRASINSLKTKQRNAFIAHLSGADHPDPFDLPILEKDLLIPLRIALDLMDTIWGTEVAFGFILGSRDPTIDFRAEFGLHRQDP